ncbi:MAG: hypothetical protein CVU39_02370 [Chloroflexi bacterium HGW-Chloroflexi-10]|jgi:uncharacterized membrane protein|nr:MAG: hypothetical protein CVU39_02370 [Chloroflexi bacterium HGW-Chloroflexi-10]
MTRKITIILAILGIADAIYLSIIKLTENKTLCVPGIGDCWTVNNSSFSEWNGIPISFFGIFAYILIIGILLYESKFSFLSRFGTIFIFGIALCGFLFSIYLTYLQIAVIKAICPFCIISAITMTSVFTITLVRLVNEQKEF